MSLRSTRRTDPHAQLRTEVSKLLESIVGRDVKVAGVRRPDKTANSVTAAFQSGGQVCGVLACDPAFANLVGAALSMMPASNVQAAIQSGELSGMPLENYTEVMNISSHLFYTSRDRSAMLDKVYAPGEQTDPAVDAFMANAKETVGMSVKISGYGDGLVILYLAET